jgi:acetoin utilization deacetylase AcuC-like enzyme
VPKAKERRIGFPVTETVARRAQCVPGGTWAAALAALERGFAANNAGGSHHALRDTGAGYCVFNDLALAAVRLVEEGRAQRVLVVDCDVHQGDGTAVLTEARDEIATYSIHAEKNFPVRKTRSTLDVALPDGTGDEDYLDVLEASLVPLLERFRPSIILYQAGIDPYEGDRLGRLALTQHGLDRRDRFVAGLARAAGLPLASTLGGGYGPDPGEVSARHARTILNLAEILCPEALAPA